MRSAGFILIILITLPVLPTSALTGRVQMIERIDVLLENRFVSKNLTNENYTICVSNGMEIKPDENGNFAVDLPKGEYGLWINVTVMGKNTSVVARIPYLFFYPSKNEPLWVTNDSFVEIVPKRVRWYPPEPITVTISGRIYDPDDSNLTVVLSDGWTFKAKVINGSFEFSNVPPGNYTVEIVPNEIVLKNGSKVVYKKTFVNAKNKRRVSIEVPYEIVKRNPSFEIVTALFVLIALRRTISR